MALPRCKKVGPPSFRVFHWRTMDFPELGCAGLYAEEREQVGKMGCERINYCVRT